MVKSKKITREGSFVCGNTNQVPGREDVCLVNVTDSGVGENNRIYQLLSLVSVGSTPCQVDWIPFCVFLLPLEIGANE